jgi:hypothetical protein
VNIDNDQVTMHVEAALHELLAAAVLLAPLPPQIPDAALDDALSASGDVQQARQAVYVALQRLRDSGVGADAVLDLEAATNALAARCAEVAFGLGQRCR